MEIPVSKFDLVFNFVELGDELHASIEYNTDLYEQATAERMAAHLQQLMSAVIEHPSEPIARLDYLGEEEKRQLLVSFNDVPPLQPRTLLVTDLFEEQVRKQPGAPAVVAGETTLSYAEVNDKVNRVAHYLRNASGVKPGDLVGIKVDRTEWMVISILGVLKSGAAYVPIDPEYPQERIDYMIADSNCRVLVDEEWLNTFREQMHLYSNANPSSFDLQPSDLAYVIYTSGSTGQPKGVMVRHCNLSNFFANVLDRHTGKAPVVMPFIASHAFDISVFQLFTPLLCGGTSLMVNREQFQDMSRFTDLLTGATFIDTVPGVYHLLANHILENKLEGYFREVEKIFIGGDAIADSLLLRLSKAFTGAEIIVTYGPTEGTIFCTGQVYAPGALPADAKGSVIGRPLGNVSLYILDAHQRPVPLGVEGEICIAGYGLTKGYLNRPELTAEKFIRVRLAEGLEVPLYRTGDMGRWLPGGTIEFRGRSDDQVKIRGYRIETGEIENALQAHAAIDSAVVTVRQNAEGEKELVAYIVSREEVTVATLRAYLGETLPHYMVPGRFVQLNELPLTPNGKVDRKKLPAPEETAMSTGSTYMPSRNRAEERMVTIWEEVLERKDIGIQDNFFDLGGNSLKIIRMVEAVNAAFGKNLSVMMGFKYPNIAELAEFLLLEEQPGESGVSDADMETDINTVDETLQILNTE
jgi:amino acid adenylation domain-containing protein